MSKFLDDPDKIEFIELDGRAFEAARKAYEELRQHYEKELHEISKHLVISIPPSCQGSHAALAVMYGIRYPSYWHEPRGLGDEGERRRGEEGSSPAGASPDERDGQGRGGPIPSR